jgi:hypothetical protein
VISEQNKPLAQRFSSGCFVGFSLVVAVIRVAVMLLRYSPDSHAADLLGGWVTFITFAVCIAIATICIRISDKRGLEFPAGMAISILVTLVAWLLLVNIVFSV